MSELIKADNEYKSGLPKYPLILEKAKSGLL